MSSRDCARNPCLSWFIHKGGRDSRRMQCGITLNMTWTNCIVLAGSLNLKCFCLFTMRITMYRLDHHCRTLASRVTMHVQATYSVTHTGWLVGWDARGLKLSADATAVGAQQLSGSEVRRRALNGWRVRRLGDRTVVRPFSALRHTSNTSASTAPHARRFESQEEPSGHEQMVCGSGWQLYETILLAYRRDDRPAVRW